MVEIDSWVLQSALRATLRRMQELVAAGKSSTDLNTIIEYQQCQRALAALEAGEDIYIVKS